VSSKYCRFVQLKVKRPLCLMMTSIQVRGLSVWAFSALGHDHLFQAEGASLGGNEEDPPLLLPVLLLTFRQSNRSHTGSSFLPDREISVSLGGRIGPALSPLGCIINRVFFSRPEDALRMLLHTH